MSPKLSLVCVSAASEMHRGHLQNIMQQSYCKYVYLWDKINDDVYALCGVCALIRFDFIYLGRSEYRF